MNGSRKFREPLFVIGLSSFFCYISRVQMVSIFCSPSLAKFYDPRPRLFFLLKKHDSGPHKSIKT
jgi:hypothetical protein